MRTPTILSVFLFMAVCGSLASQTVSSFIHVDQFGYLPDAIKVAVLSDPQQGINAADSYSPSGNIELKNVSNDQTVWVGSPQIWNGGATHGQSGDKGWWLDFSNFSTTGSYYLLDPASGERSAVFEIENDVYDQLMADAGRAFFYNRCNAPKQSPYADGPWTDATNFLNPNQDADCIALSDPNNMSLRRDLSGGWFDAGDYNKYVSFAFSAVNPLLWAYVENPNVFTDNWNIPESGNGIPDILDELKWELDWLLKMTNPDGSVINKMGSISFDDNANAPPSANFDSRYYGPTCSSASISAAGMFAHAAEVYGAIASFTGYANTLEAEAISTFNYWKNLADNNALEYDCDDGTIKAGDADLPEDKQWDFAVVAAVHLFARTGNSTYSDFVVDANNQNRLEPLETGFWGGDRSQLNDALLYYTTLAGADAALSSEIITSVTTAASNNWNGFFGLNSDDLYRGFMPDWSYFWGSNSIKARYGSLNNALVYYGINPVQADNYRAQSAALLHNFHGVNPLGLVYISGMEGRGADRGIEEIYHTWFADGTVWDNSNTSLYGPAPGFVSGGPNPNFTLNFISPPAGQPIQKSYKDWNTGWNGSNNENSWEITEPAIYYQAAYIRNLAGVMASDFALPVVYASPLQARAQERDVLLTWRVAEEIDLSHYEIEHLDVNNDWNRVGRVNARALDRYQFRHENPIEGMNNYRLKQLDLDGTFGYSNIATVQFSDRYAEIEIYPNPVVGDILYVKNLPNFGSLPASGRQAGLKIYDAQGRKLAEFTIESGTAEIDMAHFAKGWYGIELESSSGEAVWKARILRLR
ncbi:MAG: glycoside hydrolase family 9 protein [Bacteroidota bacterium]